MTSERSVTIRNKAGIHCRPSGVILNAVRDEFPGHRFHLSAPGGEIELDSMLDLLALGLSQGVEVRLTVDGPEADKAAKRIGDLLEYEFDFPPRG